MAPRADEPHCVYKHFNQSGELLYVGSTKALNSRFSGHRDSRRSQEWVHEVARTEVCWLNSYPNALYEEGRVIWQEQPLFNKLGKTTPIGGFNPENPPRKPREYSEVPIPETASDIKNYGRKNPRRQFPFPKPA